MRKKILVSVSLLLCVVMLSLINSRPITYTKGEQPKNENQVITVANNNSVDNKALEARFLNMLNHNFVYNDDFLNDNALLDNSVLALLPLAEDSYLSVKYVDDYIFNMYGITNFDYQSLDKAITEKDGYVYILPRGYSLYEHEIVSLTANMDGSYTVITNVQISLDDGSCVSERATTLFYANQESAFGFNILYSDISSNTSSALAC